MNPTQPTAPAPLTEPKLIGADAFNLAEVLQEREYLKLKIAKLEFTQRAAQLAFADHMKEHGAEVRKLTQERDTQRSDARRHMAELEVMANAVSEFLNATPPDPQDPIRDDAAARYTAARERVNEVLCVYFEKYQ